tara:strand:- start:308 stop:673 length:366 start_codon:yes stop_codon:yes gene_type:complete
MNNFTIYYSTREAFYNLIEGKTIPTIDQVTPAENPNHDGNLTHACIGTIKAEDLRDVHFKMNMIGESMNDAEWKEFTNDLQEMNVGHASMSVGDVAYCHKTQTYYYCAEFGWKALENPYAK